MVEELGARDQEIALFKQAVSEASAGAGGTASPTHSRRLVTFGVDPKKEGGRPFPEILVAAAKTYSSQSENARASSKRIEVQRNR